MISFSPNLSALQAFGVGMHGTAYNIANVNTGGFQPVAVHYRSNAPADLGVHAVVTRPPADAQARPGQFAAGATGATPPQASPETPPTHSMEKAWAKVPQSNVELAREFTTMMITQRAFEANAVTIRSNDEMLGTVLDLKA